MDWCWGHDHGVRWFSVFKKLKHIPSQLGLGWFKVFVESWLSARASPKGERAAGLSIHWCGISQYSSQGSHLIRSQHTWLWSAKGTEHTFVIKVFWESLKYSWFRHVMLAARQRALQSAAPRQTGSARQKTKHLRGEPKEQIGIRDNGQVSDSRLIRIKVSSRGYCRNATHLLNFY